MAAGPAAGRRLPEDARHVAGNQAAAVDNAFLLEQVFRKLMAAGTTARR